MSELPFPLLLGNVLGNHSCFVDGLPKVWNLVDGTFLTAVQLPTTVIRASIRSTPQPEAEAAKSQLTEMYIS